MSGGNVIQEHVVNAGSSVGFIVKKGYQWGYSASPLNYYSKDFDYNNGNCIVPSQLTLVPLNCQ